MMAGVAAVDTKRTERRDERDSLLSHPVPVRAGRTDAPEFILRSAELWFRQGAIALATLVEIRGGAAKSLGSQMAIAVDGRFCGYVSGGCVEAAVASEALLAMAEGRDRMVRYGDGSPFFDIVLPCGGGITVAIHVVREVKAIQIALDRLDRREQATLVYLPGSQTLDPTGLVERSGWQAGEFVTVFRPRTRIAISGQSLEADAVTNLAEAAGYDVVPLVEGTMIDAYTAVVLLHHDIDREAAPLDVALSSPAFYVGSLGSTRTHRKRCDRLTATGRDRQSIDRIKAPIGLFGPARDATSLALSVLADIAAASLATYP